jgi:hypothetical protein
MYLNGNPAATVLHNEVVIMTRDATLIHNLPELCIDSSGLDSSCYSASSNDSYGAQLLDVIDCFAGTEGARPTEKYIARFQVMRCLERVLEEQREGTRAVVDLTAQMATAGL